MHGRRLCFWGPVFAIACGGSDGSNDGSGVIPDDAGEQGAGEQDAGGQGAEGQGGAGQGGAGQGGAGQGGAGSGDGGALDGGEPANDAGGSHPIGAAGTSGSSGGAANTPASGGTSGDTPGSGGAGDAGTGAPPEGSGGESGGAGTATLRVDVTYGGACGSDAERCSTRTFDEAGNLVGAFEDGDCDGVPDAQCTTIAFWEGGSRSEHDPDCSGQPTMCSIQLVVPNDDHRAAAGENCVRAAAQCTTYLKDATGANLGYEVDDNCDGTLESCLYFREETPGTLHGAYDIGCDGTADSGCMTTTVDASTGYTREERDSDCDGQPELVRCFVDDEDGVSRNAGQDSDCDGALDVSCHTWTYDESGKPIGLAHDDDCDGTFDYGCTTFSTDAFGNATSESDRACDQATCWTWVDYGFSGGSGPMVDIGCDGEVDNNCEIWSLDDEGRPLRVDYDYDCDGTPSLAPDSTGPCWTTWKYTRL